MKAFTIKLLLFSLGIICVVAIKAQSDSAIFDKKFRFRDGIYTSSMELINNNPYYKGYVLHGKDDQESLFGRNDFYYSKDDVEMGEYNHPLFAYVHEGQPWLFYKNDFRKLILTGPISTFLVEQYHIFENGDDGYVDKLYFIDFKTGEINKLLPENVESIFKRDREFYMSFVSKSYRLQKKTLYSFVLKYNALHPVYLLTE